MILGDIVMVVGGFDNRVRQVDTTNPVLGTLEMFLADNQLSVLLPDGQIWVGSSKNVVLASENT